MCLQLLKGWGTGIFLGYYEHNPPNFVGKQKKNKTKQNPQLLDSPTTWNFNDSPGLPSALQLYKEMTIAGLKIVAHQQTMSGQNGVLTSQKFHPLVMFTSQATLIVE